MRQAKWLLQVAFAAGRGMIEELFGSQSRVIHGHSYVPRIGIIVVRKIAA